MWSPGGVSLFIQLGTISLQATARAMKLLDLIPPYDTHKIGIIYVDKDQVSIIMCIVPSPSLPSLSSVLTSPPPFLPPSSPSLPPSPSPSLPLVSLKTQEHNILANTHCSSRYMDMLKGLGQLVDIQNCSSDAVYLGGLDQSGADGQFTYFYEDSITQGTRVWCCGVMG